MRRLEVNVLHDNIKNKYCAENNVPILRIPYEPMFSNFYDFDCANIDKKRLEQIILDFVKNETIPTWIKNHYSMQYFNTKQAVLEFLEKNNASQELVDKYKDYDFSSNYVECVREIESNRPFNEGQELLSDTAQQELFSSEGFHPDGMKYLLEAIFSETADNTNNTNFNNMTTIDQLDDFDI
jgi:hypothetical protein